VVHAAGRFAGRALGVAGVSAFSAVGSTSVALRFLLADSAAGNTGGGIGAEDVVPAYGELVAILAVAKAVNGGVECCKTVLVWRA
jgi:hypothetical protein